MSTEERLERLARHAAGGDREALRGIYEITAPLLVREVLAPLLRDRGRCEDVLRDVFTTIVASPAPLAEGPVMPYLARIARNRALDLLRRAGTEVRLREAVGQELARAPAPATPEELLATAEGRRRLRERVESVLEGMNPRYAQVLRMRLLEDRPREACAAWLGLKLNAFDVLLFRACKQFRVSYVERFGDEEA